MAGEWLEVKRPGDTVVTWSVEGCLGGKHYKIADAFPTKEMAQGSALLLAMRLLPARREALHALIDAIPGVWWWMIAPLEGSPADPRAIHSSHTSGSAAEAERRGRAAGAGWRLYVYGPGTRLDFGRLPA